MTTVSRETIHPQQDAAGNVLLASLQVSERLVLEHWYKDYQEPRPYFYRLVHTHPEPEHGVGEVLTLSPVEYQALMHAVVRSL